MHKFVSYKIASKGKCRIKMIKNLQSLKKKLEKIFIIKIHRWGREKSITSLLSKEQFDPTRA